MIIGALIHYPGLTIRRTMYISWNQSSGQIAPETRLRQNLYNSQILRLHPFPGISLPWLPRQLVADAPHPAL